MYYLGMDRARRQRLGVARSRDGIAWVKLRSSPVLELGERGRVRRGRARRAGGVGQCGQVLDAVHRTGPCGAPAHRSRDIRRRGALATLGLAPVLGGAEPWDDKVVCDPSVLAGPEAAYGCGSAEGTSPRRPSG